MDGFLCERCHAALLNGGLEASPLLRPHIVTQGEISAKLNALTPREFFLVCNGGALPERMLGLQGKNGTLI